MLQQEIVQALEYVVTQRSSRFTPIAARQLAERAAARIVRDVPPDAHSDAIATAGHSLDQVADIIANSRGLQADQRIDENDVNVAISQGRVCGFPPWC